MQNHYYTSKSHGDIAHDRFEDNTEHHETFRRPFKVWILILLNSNGVAEFISLSPTPPFQVAVSVYLHLKDCLAIERAMSLSYEKPLFMPVAGTIAL